MTSAVNLCLRLNASEWFEPETKNKQNVSRTISATVDVEKECVRVVSAKQKLDQD